MINDKYFQLLSIYVRCVMEQFIDQNEYDTVHSYQHFLNRYESQPRIQVSNILDSSQSNLNASIDT